MTIAYAVISPKYKILYVFRLYVFVCPPCLGLHTEKSEEMSHLCTQNQLAGSLNAAVL